MIYRHLSTLLALISCVLIVDLAAAGPSVVPTSEGQIGEVPGVGDRYEGGTFESIRGQPNDVILGGLFIPSGGMPPPPEFSFITDRIHATPDPVPVDSFPDPLDGIFAVKPSSSRSRNAADDGDFVAFSFAVDGSMPETMTVRIATYDENGTAQVNVPIEDIPTVPDPSFTDTGVTVDNQGRVTVVYTEVVPGGPLVADVRAQRLNATTGAVIDPSFVVAPTARANPDVALLDPAGNRILISNTDFLTVRGNIVDFSGGSPVVLPEFTISTTSDFSNVNPVVAADPSTGDFMVVWEHLRQAPPLDNPVDVRGRRFDAMGNPIGGDFVVNTTTVNAQGQPAIAYDSSGISAVAWAGDSGVFGDELDVFLQVYDADGNPIGGEIRVNTVTENVQDRPTIGFMPESDALGQPQVVVLWRDVGVADGSMPRGTGTSYKCFSIGQDPAPIFADGFESGDTSAWE